MPQAQQSPPKPPRHQVDPALYADVDGIVQVAVPCAFCSYNLQTLRLGSNCPECGKAVGFRFVPELLQNAPVEWLRRVRWGLRIYVISVLVAFLAAVGSGLASYFMVMSGSVEAERIAAFTNSWWFAAAENVFSLAFTAISAYGAWLFTSPRPAAAIPDRALSRKAVRVGVVISTVALCVMIITGIGGGVERLDENLTTAELVITMCIVP
ncbi:MAG: hypothetical protein ACKVS9_03585, partial [Phycisphaerae bacterium]